MAKNLKNKVLTGIAWQYFQRVGYQIIHFVVSLILARLLMPEDFGIVALLGVFVSVSNIFIDSGFSNALIQRKVIDEIDCSSVFYLNVMVSILIYSIVFLCSPFVAQFYQMPQLTPLLRILSIQIIIMSFNCVQQALLVRQMKFRYNFYIGIFSVTISSLVGIVMAYSGWGVWSIVYIQIVAQLCTGIGLWTFVAWRPHWLFSWKRIKYLFSYGSRILGGSIINVLYNNIYNLVIGKRYSPSDLGFYNRGQLLPTTIIDTASTSFNSVLFPVLSSVQDDKVRYKSFIRRSSKMTAFIVFFLAAFMCAFAPQIIRFLLGEKWLPAVPFMCIVCVTVCVNPLIVINQTICTSLGRSDYFMRTTFISKFLSILIIIWGAFYNVYMMVIAGAVANIITFIITAVYNKRLIGYSIKDMLCDASPALILASISCGVSYLIMSVFSLNDLFHICLGGVFSLGVYLSLAYVTRQESLQFILNNISKKGK